MIKIIGIIDLKLIGESAHGPEQSLLHYTILIDKLPEWLKKKKFKKTIILSAIWDVEWVKELKNCMKVLL